MSRRAVQYFAAGEGMYALADDGTVWRRVVRHAEGAHAFEPPTDIRWERADERFFPPLPQE